MTVQDATRVVSVPPQAVPADPPPAPEPTTEPAGPAPLIGRDRPRTADERQFLPGGLAMCLVLSAYILTGLLLSEFVWG